MKKFNIILGIAVLACMASCGNSTENNQNADSPATEATGTNETPAETTPPPASNSEPAATEQTSTKVDVNKDGASVSTDKAKVDVDKDGASLEIKKD